MEPDAPEIGERRISWHEGWAGPGEPPPRERGDIGIGPWTLSEWDGHEWREATVTTDRKTAQKWMGLAE